MDNSQRTQESDNTPRAAMSPWKITGWICAGVIVLSVLSCVVMAGFRSNGLVKITVTALDGASEPRDHILPFIKRKESLPDYEIIVILKDGEQIRLGAKPDTSAVDGLSWSLNDPISLVNIASVRLQEQDKIISDAIVEVQITSNSITEKGYRFDFDSKHSFSGGIGSFFQTPIGKAIAAGFCIAILLILLSVFLTVFPV